MTVTLNGKAMKPRVGPAESVVYRDTDVAAIIDKVRGNRRTTAWDQFARADGLFTTSADGQTYLQAGDSSATLFGLIGGKAGQGAVSGGTFGNGYLSLDAGGTIESIVGEWTFEPGTSGAVVAVVITGDTTISRQNLLHWITTDVGWNLQTTTTGPGGLITIASGTYATALAGDSTTRYRFEMVPDVAKTRVTLRMPDGSTQVVTHASITSTIVQTRAYWQVIRHSLAEKDPRFTGFGLTTVEAAAPLVAGTNPKDAALAIDSLNTTLRAALVPRSTLTFTPNATGWWRVWDLTGTNVFGGLFNISTPASAGANITDVTLQINATSFTATVGTITQTRYCAFQSGAISQARIGSDGSNHLYFDLFVSTANIAVTVEGIGVQVNAVQNAFASYTPVAAPTTPTNVVVLVLGKGLRTTNALAVGSHVVTATANVDTNFLLTEVDATAGNVTLTLPTATTVPGHMHTFSRIDATANTVSIVGFYSDGTTTKNITNAAGFRVIASAAANRWALA